MKAYTDLEQSKVLAKILPEDSADMTWFIDDDEPQFGKFCPSPDDYGKVYPCWSLAALLEVLPQSIEESYYAPNLQKDGDKYSVAYGHDVYLCEADNPIDACYEMIVKLNTKIQ